MKKLLLATAIAASVATGANAATTYTVSSNITGMQLWLGQLNVFSSPLAYNPGSGSFTDLAFGGTATDANDDGIIDSADLTFTGQATFNANNDVHLNFHIASNNYVAGSGTTFNSGGVDIDIDSGSGFAPYGTIDASTTNLPFLTGQPGHLGLPQTTAGLLFSSVAPGVNVIGLPGLWDGQIDGSGYNNAVSSLTLLSNTSGMFLDGTITLTSVPVPGAAWLFGSAMVGLAGAARKRKTAV